MAALSIEYAAGFFDGEGSVGVYKSNGRYRAACCITNTARHVLAEFQKRWGGNIYEDNRNARVVYRWSMGGRYMTDFLRAIRPHLLEKGEQVDLMLDYYGADPDFAFIEASLKELKRCGAGSQAEDLC